MKHLYLLLILFSLNGIAQTFDFTKYNDFLKDHVSNKGVVDYDKVIKNMDDLSEITKSFSKISPNASWSQSEYKAFWINLYNANLIKILAENYPIKSITYIEDYLKKDNVEFNGTKISLDFIKDEIIRKIDDPRVHFALFTTAISSPILSREAYSMDNVEVELNFATMNFLNDETKNKIGPKYCKVSKIFFWYIKDFGGDKQSVIEFIKNYNKEITINSSIDYMDYNWNLYH